MPTPSASTDILILLSLNDRGGAEISMVRIAQALLERGYPIHLVIYGTQPHLARSLGFKGKITDLHSTRTFKAGWAFYRVLRALKPKVLLAALTHTNLLAVATACLAGRRTSVFVTEHGIDGLRACDQSWWFRQFVKHTYKRARLTITVSKGLEGQWQKILGDPVSVRTIYNPSVSDQVLVPTIAAYPWLRVKDRPVILGSGRLKVEKNFDLLIRAFEKVTTQKDARLIILGEGPERKRLEELVALLGLSDKVLLPGFIDEPGPWLSHADLFVSSSNREGFGNAIVEAMAWGISIVATDCPYGPAEILENGRYGSLTPVGDGEALADAIIQALAKPTDRDKLRDRASLFSTSRCIDLYSKLIDNPGL